MTWLTWIAARPDAVLFAIGDENGRIRVWMPADNRVVATHETGRFVNRVGWTADGKHLLATGAASDLLVFDHDGTLEQTIATGHDAIRSFGVHPSEPLVATTGGDGRVRVWDLTTRAVRLELPAEKSAGTAVGMSAGHVFAGFESGGFVIWDLTGKEMSGGQLFTGSYVSACAAKPDGTTFVFGGGRGSMVAIDDKWVSVHVWRDPPKPIATNSIEMLADGRMIAAHSDDTASLFAKPRSPFPSALGSHFYTDRKPWEQKYIVSSACFIPSTKLAATSHFTGSLRLWTVDGYPWKQAEVSFEGDEPTWANGSGEPITDPSAWWAKYTG
jgi:WD40 repeat protein